MKTTESGRLRRDLSIALAVFLLSPILFISPKSVFATGSREAGGVPADIGMMHFSVESQSEIPDTNIPLSGNLDSSLDMGDLKLPSVGMGASEIQMNAASKKFEQRHFREIGTPGALGKLDAGKPSAENPNHPKDEASNKEAPSDGIAGAQKRVEGEISKSRDAFKEDRQSQQNATWRRQWSNGEEVFSRGLDPEDVADHPETPTLDQFGADLTQQAIDGKIDLVYGREKEIEDMVDVIAQKRKRNVVLIGEAGVGKTAIVEGLAQRIVSGRVPIELRGKRIISLDVGALLAGTMHRGDFEARIQGVIKDAQSDPNIILFIDELHQVMGANTSTEGNSTSMANMLKQALARGSIQLIGATTLDEYRQHIEKDAAFERRLQPITVEAPTRDEAVKILEKLSPEFEKHHRVHFGTAVLESMVDAAIRYIPSRNLPDSAVDLLDRVGSYAQRKGHKRATENDVLAVVSKISRIPAEKMGGDEKSRLVHIEDHLRQRVMGQEEAVHEVAEAIRAAKTGFNLSKGPLASFLFAGPTGVGKTELAGALTEFLFGTERNLIHLDMSEYQDAAQQSRAIGAAPGYIGSDKAGGLTEKVRRNPYSVVLLDEVDKAHPDFLNLLLQVLDKGRLTDSSGRTVDFTHAVVIMTANYMSRELVETKKTMGFNPDASPSLGQRKDAVLSGIQGIIKPEIYNRIGDVVIFNPLDRETFGKILDGMIAQVLAIAKTKGMEIEITPAAREFLLSKGYDPRYGARNMRRAVERHLSRPLGTESLKENHATHLRVSVNSTGEKLSFESLQ